MPSKLAATCMLLTTSLLWSSAFSFRKMALAHVGAFFFNGCRSFIGCLFVFSAYLISAYIKRRGMGSHDLSDYKPLKWQLTGGFLMGLASGLGGNLQQLGLLTSDAGKCGFISAFYIFFTPLISRVILNKKIEANIWTGAVIAVVGLFFVSVGDSFEIVTGDILFLVAAVFFAAQVILIGYFTTYSNPYLFISMALFTSSALSMALSLAFEVRNGPDEILSVLFPILYTGMLATGVALTLQVIAQKKTSPSITAIIMSFESVFGAVFAAMILGERMNARQLFGCGLIFFASLIAQIERRNRR